MNITLWVLQVLLALAFFAHGALMLWPPPEILAMMDAAYPRPLGLFIGVAEILAAFALIVPGLTRIMPGLVPSAAAGLAIVMICATLFHGARGEWSSAATTALLLAITVFVAYMRWRVKPILPRTR
jgi:uncharacterized membrane protein YphA (DoxX/SURF4 family)